MAIEVAWRGEIMLGTDWGLFVGEGRRSRRHEHPALKIVSFATRAPALTRREPVRVARVLISRNGHSLRPCRDRDLLRGPETSITDLLPRRWFPSDADATRLTPLTLKQTMGMAALDAPDPPRMNDPEAVARQRRFWLAPNRGHA